MTERPLKSGWKRVRFGEVVRLNTNRCSDPLAAGIERYVGLEHIEPENLRIRRWGLVSEGTTFTNYFKPGQVLFGKRRAYQRKVAVADFEGVCSSDIYVFEPKDNRLLSELLPYICQTEAFYQHAVETSAGSLSPRTNWEQLARYEFALPPPEEQKRITFLLNNIDTYIVELDKSLSGLKILRKAYTVEKFNQITRECTNIVKVSQAGEVLMGRQRSPKYAQGISPRPYLRVANLYDGYIDTTDIKNMDFSDSEYEIFRLKIGDVLLVEGHSSADVVGRSAIFRNEVQGACFQNTLLRFRPYSVSPEYSHQFFRYCLYMGKFSSVAKQTTIAHLGSSRFSNMNFPLVSKEVDRTITSTVSDIEANLTSLRYQISANKGLKSRVIASEFEQKRSSC